MSHTPLVIIGSGPAGYSAAIYAGRALLAPVLFAGPEVGGQLTYTTDIENYAGFPQGKAGPELMFDMREQAVRFGTIIRDELVTALNLNTKPFGLYTRLPQGVTPAEFNRMDKAKIAKWQKEITQTPPDLTADAIIIATGATSIMTGIPGEARLLGRGVSTCAVCDAAFYKNKTVFVVGGGDSAMEDALALAKFTDSVTIVHRRDSFRASKIMQDRVLQHPHIKVLWNAQITEVTGEQKVEKVKIERRDEKGVRVLEERPADGMFLAIGHSPVTGFLPENLHRTSAGYLLTRMSWSQEGLKLANQYLDKNGLVAYPTMTSVEGVFGAGDVVDFRYRQAISAAGSGCMAALDVEKYLESRHDSK